VPAVSVVVLSLALDVVTAMDGWVRVSLTLLLSTWDVAGRA
jgi:hypothetical protein